MRISRLQNPITDHTTELGTEISTKYVSKQTTVHQTYMSSKLNFTNKSSASTEQPISQSTSLTISIKHMPIQKTVQQTHMLNLTNKTSSSTEHPVSMSISTTISRKHVTKKKPTLELKKTTDSKFDIKSTNQRSTSNIRQITKKTPSTKKTETKADARKSNHISKGEQAVIGVTISVVGVGLVLALIFLTKKKIKKIGINDKTNQKNVQKSNNDKQTVLLYMNVLPKGRVDHMH